MKFSVGMHSLITKTDTYKCIDIYERSRSADILLKYKNCYGFFLFQKLTRNDLITSYR